MLLEVESDAPTRYDKFHVYTVTSRDCICERLRRGQASFIFAAEVGSGRLDPSHDKEPSKNRRRKEEHAGR